MVNNQPHRVLVAGACSCRSGAQGRIWIDNGPVYDLTLVQQLVKAHGVRVLNTKAQDDQKTKFTPSLSDSELADLIGSLTPDCFDRSERCSTSAKMQIDCDGYTIKWNRNTRNKWDHGPKYFVKFGFSNNGPGQLCLVISIHPALH
jgi:hypothetical protein